MTNFEIGKGVGNVNVGNDDKKRLKVESVLQPDLEDFVNESCRFTALKTFKRETTVI